jgi:nicotinamide-nucleotide amidase
VIAYSDAVKRDELDVSPATLAEHGAVSAETAAELADGARTRLGTDVSVAVTGVAGPGGGTAEKPVGLVFIHAVSPTGEDSLQVTLPGDREAVRARATSISLHLLRRLLAQNGTPPRAVRD